MSLKIEITLQEQADGTFKTNLTAPMAGATAGEKELFVEICKGIEMAMQAQYEGPCVIKATVTGKDGKTMVSEVKS